MTYINQISIKDGSSSTVAKIKTDGTDNALVVTQNAAPLPTDAATETTLVNIDGKLTACDTSNISGAVTSTPSSTYYENIFSVAGSGVTQDVSSGPKKSFSIQCVAVGGTLTSWTVDLEASLDGVTFTTILTHATADGDSASKFTGSSLYPARYFRVNATDVTLNTATGLKVIVLAL